jgi:iron complex transport system ATP-binding protein
MTMPQPTPTLFSAKKLAVSVPGRSLVRDLDLDLGAGELLAVLGRNGAGKSLTLHTLAGLRKAGAGLVELDGAAITTLPRKTIAQRLALLPQDSDDIFPASVLETVLIGRHPHIEPLRWESVQDQEIARNCLQEMDLAALADREISTLSGGERRRLAIAQILAQDPGIYLLDEPTNHLDPQHQLDVLKLFVERARKGAAVVACLHDVNLAARFADRCLLLYGDGQWHLGDTADVLSEDRLSKLYNVKMEALNWRNQKLFVAAGASADMIGTATQQTRSVHPAL